MNCSIADSGTLPAMRSYQQSNDSSVITQSAAMSAAHTAVSV